MKPGHDVVEIAQWKGRRRTSEKSATCTWSENWAVSKVRHKEAEKGSSLEKAGHRTICCRTDVRHNFAEVAVPLARTRRLPRGPGPSSRACPCGWRAQAGIGSVGRSRSTSTRGLSRFNRSGGSHTASPAKTAGLAGLTATDVTATGPGAYTNSSFTGAN